MRLRVAMNRSKWGIKVDLLERVYKKKYQSPE